jgi:hypothetical protein
MHYLSPAHPYEHLMFVIHFEQIADSALYHKLYRGNKYIMRFLELYEQLLLEHNVVNNNDISDFVEQFAADCKNENAAEWFKVVLARYLEKDDQTNVPLNDTNIPRNAPAWLDAAIERGDDLRVFQPPVHLVTSFHHLVDYFDFLHQNADPVIQNRDRLMKVTVDIALRKATDWSDASAKDAASSEVGDVTEVFRDGAYRWVEPNTLEACKRDAAILGHCTAQGVYDSEFKSKAMRFFFLHDRKGQPHVCVSIKNKTTLDQAKGKQNKAPVGRYAQLCANFINSLHLHDLSDRHHDLKNMGLVVNEEGLLSLVSQTGKVVFKIGDVRVYETDATPFEVVDRGYGRSNTNAGGGKDYWFNSPEGDLFRINVGKNGLAHLCGYGCDSDRARTLAVEFLNNFFEGGAPPPLETSPNTTSQNDLVYDFKLKYDYLTKRYGTIQEVASSKLEIEGGYSAFTHNKKVYGALHPSIMVFGPESDTDAVLEVVLDGKGRVSSPAYGFDDKVDLLIKVLNAIDAAPAADVRRFGFVKWRAEKHVFYDLASRKWGGIEVVPVVWSKGNYSLHRREEEAGEDVHYMMVKKGQPDCFYEWRKSPQGNDSFSFIDPKDGSLMNSATGISDKEAQKTMMAVLNGCEELNWLRESSAGNLDEFNIFYNKGKWQSREKAGEVFHRFDDGAYITAIPRHDTTTYSIYNGSETLLCAIDASSARGGVGTHFEFSKDKIHASRYLLWLFNHISVSGATDTIDGDRGYGGKDSVKGFLWRMGLFYDNRSESWKLIQDGKLIYDGDGYRAVNFRNRVFIVDNEDGCVGWFKKGEPRTEITGETVFIPHTMSDLYRYLADLCKHTDFEMPAPSFGEQDRRRSDGFAFGPDGTFDAIDRHHPPEVVLTLPKGYTWVRKAHDSRFYQHEKEHDLHHNRFSLCNKDGESFMRVEIDEGFLGRVVFSAKDTFDAYQTTTSLAQMKDGPQKKYLLALLKKIDANITPAQATELKYYRTKDGSFKSLTGNKMLQSFLQGRIDFGDGHVFKRDNHYSREKSGQLKWELGIENPEAEHHYERFNAYIRIVLDEDGIESVHYLNKDVKRKPNEYMPYIQKLMKIFATISGD